MKKRYHYVVSGLVLLLLGCEKVCVRSDRCRLTPDGGPCFAAFPKYYYDPAANRCRRFIYGGCGGTVPFETLTDCQQRCTCGR